MNRSALALVLLATLSAGCPPADLELYPDCLVAVVPSPSDAAVGDVVTLTGGPFSEVWDTVVRVDGVDAVVLDVVRDGCSACDECRAEADGCLACGACDTCESICEDCVQTVTFVVPDVPPGEATLVLFDRYGQSAGVALTVLGSVDDTDTDSDTDAPDTDAPAP